jgi:peptidyl-tRNA hydrolase
MKIKGNNGGDQAKLKSNLIKSEINTKQSPRNEIGISRERERESQTSDLVLMWLTSAATPGVPAIS